MRAVLACLPISSRCQATSHQQTGYLPSASTLASTSTHDKPSTASLSSVHLPRYVSPLLRLVSQSDLPCLKSSDLKLLLSLPSSASTSISTSTSTDLPQPQIHIFTQPRQLRAQSNKLQGHSLVNRRRRVQLKVRCTPWNHMFALLPSHTTNHSITSLRSSSPLCSVTCLFLPSELGLVILSSGSNYLSSSSSFDLHLLYTILSHTNPSLINLLPCLTYLNTSC